MDKGLSGSNEQYLNKLSKHSLSDLHEGDVHSPLTALGRQEVKVSSPMGHGESSMGARAPKGEGRSIAKDLIYNAKKRMK